MALVDFYPLIKATHVGFVMLSGGLFAGRGLGVLGGARLPMAPALRRLSVGIDSALLASALLLLLALQINPLATPWLRAKLLLLAAYIVLGSLALKRARSRRGKALAFLAAIACFLMMVLIARTHDPRGGLF